MSALEMIPDLIDELLRQLRATFRDAGNKADQRIIIAELLRTIASALEQKPTDFEQVRRIIEAAPGRLIGFDDEHRRIVLGFLENMVTALDRLQAGLLSDRGRLQ